MGRKSSRLREDRSSAKGASRPTTEVALVTDDRFSAVHWDPRFGRVPRRASKVVVDDRFKHELKKNPAFRGTTTRVDRFGRSKDDESRAALERVFELRSDSDESEGESEAEHETSVDQSGRWDENGLFEDSDTPAQHLKDGASDGTEPFRSAAQERLGQIPRGSATHRLAVIGLDWSKTRAVDVFASLSSFCPTGKKLLRVDIHPSKLGMSRLAQEARFGPEFLGRLDAQLVRRLEPGKHNAGALEDGLSTPREGTQTGDDAGSGVSSGPGEENSSDEEASSDLDAREDIKNMDDQEAIRKYEKERLQYFYGIAKFDSVAAAEAVYEECDGVEFQSTGLTLDLRFVPDDMRIEAPVRESAECVPDTYAPPALPPSNLNNSNVKLSWDEDAPERAVLKKRRFSAREEEDMDLKAYLADSSGDEQGDRNPELEEKKKRLLLGMTEEDTENDAAMEMEVTFEPGLLEKGEEIVERKAKRDSIQNESEWEARLRRMQERKADKRRERKRRLSDADRHVGAEGADSDSEERGVDVDQTPGDDDFFVADSVEGFAPKTVSASHPRRRSPRPPTADQTQRGKRKTDDIQRTEDDEAHRQRAELELLLMSDDRDGTDHKGKTFSSRLVEAESDEDTRVGKQDRRRRRRNRKPETAAVQPDDDSGGIESDSRFASLFTSHEYALDPTHPKFKRTATTEGIVKRRSALKSNVGAGRQRFEDPNASSGKTNSRDTSGSAINDEETSRLVHSLKARLRPNASHRRTRAETK